MADLTYKSITLVEQAQPAHARAHQYWYGVDGNVELSLGLNTDSGTYTAHARVRRSNPRGGGTILLPAGVSEGSDWEAALDAACTAFVARAQKPDAQKRPRELDMRAADASDMAVVIGRTRLAQVR
jgi:hypothetical protein